MKKLFITACAISLALGAQAQRTFHNDQNEADVVERDLPASWSAFVKGGQFIDRFQTMPEGELSSDVWGADGVLPRYIDNGIETDEFSFWGGNILKGDDGLYHLFVCGWREDNPRGFRFWGHSKVFHTVCDNLIGPYEIKDTIGYGHNPDTYRLKDGRYVTSVFSMATKERTFGYYLSPSIDGPWEYHTAEFLPRDRKISVTTNLSFERREDGSVIGIGKDGKMWISRTGISPYSLITQNSAYPDIAGYMEDPDIWLDNVQYNLVFNDAKGRVAYYMRSKDGVNWVWEEGVAYRPGLLTIHKDGTVEDWHKYERIKIYNDEHGRAIQANFGVLDIDKGLDKSNDEHSSKNISIPIKPSMLIEWAGSESSMPSGEFCPKVRIIAEKGFNPQRDIDIKSLRLGEAGCVNFGGGSCVVASEKQGKDLILTFDSKGHHISAEEFAPKLLGRDNKGEMIYGYTRLPWVEYDSPILSSLAAKRSGKGATIEVENWGVHSSKRAQLELYDATGKLIAKSEIEPIEPYKSSVVQLATPLREGVNYTTKIYLDGTLTSTLTFHVVE